MKYILPTLVAVAIFIAGFLAKGALENDTILGFIRTQGATIAAVFLAGLAILGLSLLLGYHYARHRLRKLLGTDEQLSEADIVAGLIDQFTSTEGVTDPTPQDRQRAALLNAGTWLMRRQSMQFYFNATVTVVGGLVGAATLFLLHEQNAKIGEQNRKLTLQTDANIADSLLQEGTRRASLSGEMANLFEAIRNEATDAKRNCTDTELQVLNGLFDGYPYDCWQREPLKTINRFHLSRDLRARVESFAIRSTPYRVSLTEGKGFDFDQQLREQIDVVVASPERGQLLETLTQNKVYSSGFDFTYAQLANANLSNADLSFTQLNNAYMPGIQLYTARLISTQMANANLQSAQIFNSDLTDAVLEGANLGVAFLQGSNLRKVSFRTAHLSKTSFAKTQLDGTLFTNTWAWKGSEPWFLDDQSDVFICEFDPEIHVPTIRPDACWANDDTSASTNTDP